MTLFELIRNKWARWRLMRAIAEAEALHARTGKRCYVFNVGGRLKVWTTLYVKYLRRKRLLRAGVTTDDLKRKALYKTA